MKVKLKVDIAATLLLLTPKGRAAEGRLILVKVESPILIATMAATLAHNGWWVALRAILTLAVVPGPPLGRTAVGGETGSALLTGMCAGTITKAVCLLGCLIRLNMLSVVWSTS